MTRESRTMTDIIQDIVNRLEIRRMESADYKARWCLSCLRTEIRSPFAMLHPGGDGSCKQTMSTGTISECIDAFKCEQAELASLPAAHGAERTSVSTSQREGDT